MSADHLLPETIGAIIDGELVHANEAAVQAHLNECHRCALKVIATGRLKSATSRAARNFAPSADALARLTAAAQQNRPKRATVIPIRSVAWAAVAALFLAVLVIGGEGILRQSQALSAEILDQHLATLSAASLPQVVSSDRHTVKPWFQGKLPFSFNVPEPNALPADTTLVGADLAYVGGKPAALLLFTIHKHHVSVFISQAELFSEVMSKTSRSGFHFSSTKAAGLELLGVSDVNGSELDALVAKLAAVQ
jgi:anti-sigma factor RsiW